MQWNKEEVDMCALKTFTLVECKKKTTNIQKMLIMKGKNEIKWSIEMCRNYETFK